MTTEIQNSDNSLIPEHASIEMIANEIERRNEIGERIRKILNSKLDPERDIDLIHGNPCRNKNAAKKAFRIFGGKFEFLKDDNGHPILIKKTGTDEYGPWYTYECFGSYTSPFGNGDKVEASGMFGSRDKFFGKNSGSEDFKPLNEIDEGNIRQAAQTECFKKCIFLGLGLTDLSEGELRSIGVDTEKITGHKGEVAGKKGGNTDGDTEANMRGEIERMCRDMFKGGMKSEFTGSPFSSPESVLKDVTSSANFNGWSSFKKISSKGVKPTFQNVIKAYSAWEKSIQTTENDQEQE